jgi:hypothetical protein
MILVQTLLTELAVFLSREDDATFLFTRGGGKLRDPTVYVMHHDFLKTRDQEESYIGICTHSVPNILELWTLRKYTGQARTSDLPAVDLGPPAKCPIMCL